MGLIEIGRNFLQVKRTEAELLRLVRKHGPQGRLVDLPENVLTSDAMAHYAVAAQNLVNKYPDITIHRYQDRLSLGLRQVADNDVGANGKMSPDDVKRLFASPFNAKPGDDPFLIFDPEMVAKPPAGAS